MLCPATSSPGGWRQGIFPEAGAAPGAAAGAAAGCPAQSAPCSAWTILLMEAIK